MKTRKILKNSVLTEQIIASAISVHRELGPGFLESFYEKALSLEFDARGIPYLRQKTVPVLYLEKLIGEHRLDFLVSNSVVLELKAVSALEDVHFAIVRSYLKACDLETGLLINFATMPLAIRRVSREHSFYKEPANLKIPAFSPS